MFSGPMVRYTTILFNIELAPIFIILTFAGQPLQVHMALLQNLHTRVLIPSRLSIVQRKEVGVVEVSIQGFLSFSESTSVQISAFKFHQSMNNPLAPWPPE